MSAGGVEFSSVPTKEQKPMEVRSGDVGNPLLVAPEDVETPTTLDAAPAPAPGGTLSRAVVALVRCMVGPAALYIPKGFSDAGGRGGDGDGPSRAGLGGSGVASAGGGGAIAAHWGAARSAE